MNFFIGRPSNARSSLPPHRLGAHRRLVGVARDHDLRALLAIDLHGQANQLLNHQRGIGDRPGRSRHESRVAKIGPALLGDMRGHRSHQNDQRPRRLAEGEGEIGGNASLGHGVQRGGQLIGEFADARDGAVESQPLDVLGDLRDGAMRGLAQF